MLDELEWPSLEPRRDKSSLLLFHKIHCGAVSIEKYKYMIPAHSLKATRSPHNSDALKNSFFPQTIPHWNSLSPSVANFLGPNKHGLVTYIQVNIYIGNMLSWLNDD